MNYKRWGPNMVENRNDFKTKLAQIANELDDLLKTKYDEVDKQLQSAGRRAPQSYLDDMNGCLRGMSIFRHTVIHFFSEKI